jgi:transposase-like protein
MREVKEPPDREPLQAVRMGMSSRYSMEEIAEAVGRVRSLVGEWTRKYRQGGVTGLLDRKSSWQ